MSILSYAEHSPSIKQVFWCNKCDHHQIDSDDASTGKFFVIFGHAYSQKSKEYDDTYTGVMMALCQECLRV